MKSAQLQFLTFDLEILNQRTTLGLVCALALKWLSESHFFLRFPLGSPPSCELDVSYHLSAQSVALCTSRVDLNSVCDRAHMTVSFPFLKVLPGSSRCIFFNVYPKLQSHLSLCRMPRSICWVLGFFKDYLSPWILEVQHVLIYISHNKVQVIPCQLTGTQDCHGLLLFFFFFFRH